MKALRYIIFIPLVFLIIWLVNWLLHLSFLGIMSLSNFWVKTLLIVFGVVIVITFHLLPGRIAWLSAKVSPSKKFAFCTLLIICTLFSVSFIVLFLSTTYVYENEYGKLGLLLGLILTCLIIGINSSLSIGVGFEMYNEKSTFLGILAVIYTVIFYLGIFLAFCLLTVEICYIDPNKSYSWFAGAWHGLFIIPHWIVSWFSDDIYCKAPNSTIAYSVWWWLTFVFSSLSILGAGGSNRS